MAGQKLKKWKTTRSEYLFKDRWITVRADSCVTPQGAVVEPYYVLEYPDWVNCLVLGDDNEVTLLSQYRQGVNDYVLELIGGIIDEGESAKETLLRELEEEIGLVDAELHQTGICYANPSNQNNKNYCFVALGGSFTGKLHHESSETMHTVKMPFKDLLERIEKGDGVFQALHLANIHFALNYLKKINRSF